MLITGLVFVTVIALGETTKAWNHRRRARRPRRYAGRAGRGDTRPAARMRDLPTGTVTFLFTDIEGSTRLLHEHGERYADSTLWAAVEAEEAKGPLAMWTAERDKYAAHIPAAQGPVPKLTLEEAVAYALSPLTRDRGGTTVLRAPAPAAVPARAVRVGAARAPESASAGTSAPAASAGTSAQVRSAGTSARESRPRRNVFRSREPCPRLAHPQTAVGRRIG